MTRVFFPIVLVSAIVVAIVASDSCERYETKTLCTAAAKKGCEWCGNHSQGVYPSGRCYTKGPGKTCCAVPNYGQWSMTCTEGPALICNGTETCSAPIFYTHYGPCYTPACCPPERPVACNNGEGKSACYPKGYTCCQMVVCGPGKACCDSQFHSGACCDSKEHCCGNSWDMYCCADGYTCAPYENPQCVKKK
jgi:hypothetical protein